MSLCHYVSSQCWLGDKGEEQKTKLDSLIFCISSFWILCGCGLCLEFCDIYSSLSTQVKTWNKELKFSLPFSDFALFWFYIFL